jgi:hypothetical protein
VGAEPSDNAQLPSRAADVHDMTAPTSDSWVADWLEDFRLCLHGAHGAAWRARAEQELRMRDTALASNRLRAASWRRTREEIIGTTAA